MAKTVAAGQIGGGEAVCGGEGHLDGAGGRQVGAETRADLPIKGGERADRDRVDRQNMLLEDDEADAAARGGVDAVPAEELFHRTRVMRLVSLTEIVGEGAQAARIPPAPGGDQRDAKQKASQRRGEAAEPGMPEEELLHEGEGR